MHAESDSNERLLHQLHRIWYYVAFLTVSAVRKRLLMVETHFGHNLCTIFQQLAKRIDGCLENMAGGIVGPDVWKSWERQGKTEL